MSIQIGTVDGLVNISNETIQCFVNAINQFSKEGISYAKNNRIPFGTAFQRFVEPVYSKNQPSFDTSNILIPALTSNNNEQSPSKATYCKKMGLLNIDEANSMFELTHLGKELYDGRITTNEYAFILLSKQGIFKDGIFIDNLLSIIAEWFETNAVISDTQLVDEVQRRYGDTVIVKSRFDIILNSLSFCGLISPVQKNKFVISDLQSAHILKVFHENSQSISKAIIDNAPEYSQYIGSLEHGVFDILSVNNASYFINKYPNLLKYSTQKDTNKLMQLSKKLIVNDKELVGFVYKTFRVLEEYDNFQSFIKYQEKSNIQPDIPSYQIAFKDGKHTLTGCFISTTKNDINSRNLDKRRWFVDTFAYDGGSVYLSTQWNGRGNYQLTFDDLQYFINHCYHDVFLLTNDNKYSLFSIDKLPVLPLQQIFYGAPGTGKSHTINKTTKGKIVIRTTFHPDSDYSTFVGAYKPTMGEPRPIYGFNGGATIKAEDPKGTVVTDPKIEYKFVMQAFLKAYLKAWKNHINGEQQCEPVFLIIEEINRGNCAQIFGDIFQLLDRGDNGFSEYPIEPDTDIQQEIGRAFREDAEYQLEGDINVEGIVDDYSSTSGKTLSEDIQSGHVMLLPNNLYIWATMNTSDQSLFPIDSAFKRRWDWKYIKIAKGKDNTGNDFEWKIDLKDKSGNDYDWWAFLEKINVIINSMTQSADKQLGYFFCKANNGHISVDTFVNKVLFYLWNDVFKDYAYEDGSLFKFKKDDSKEELSLTFPDFFKESGEIDDNVVRQFIDNVMSWNEKSDKKEQE